MSVPTVTAWRDTYVEVAERLTEQARAARPVFTGGNACVDAIFHIGAERMARLTARAAAASSSADDLEGTGLLARVLERVVAGRGGELLTRWPAGPAWMTDLLGMADCYQLGGVGAQASWALAVLGAPSVLALADRSAEQLSVIDPRIGVCANGRVVPAGTLTPSGSHMKLPHCILEFTAGTRCGDREVPRSTRLILRFGDEPFERDEEFATTTTAIASETNAALLSGLNGVADGDIADRDWLVKLSRSWSNAGVQVIHHELAEFPTTQRLRDALDTHLATSVGLSLSELHTLAGRRGDPRVLAREAAERAGAKRVIVHGDEWALAVHRDEPRHQRDVLLAGNTLAAARAHAGQPTGDLAPASGVTYTDDLPPAGRIGGGWYATSVPSPYLRRPAATIGLGDTFVAGVLLAESVP